MISFDISKGNINCIKVWVKPCPPDRYSNTHWKVITLCRAALGLHPTFCLWQHNRKLINILINHNKTFLFVLQSVFRLIPGCCQCTMIYTYVWSTELTLLRSHYSTFSPYTAYILSVLLFHCLPSTVTSASLQYITGTRHPCVIMHTGQWKSWYHGYCMMSCNNRELVHKLNMFASTISITIFYKLL